MGRHTKEEQAVQWTPEVEVDFQLLKDTFSCLLASRKEFVADVTSTERTGASNSLQQDSEQGRKKLLHNPA